MRASVRWGCSCVLSLMIILCYAMLSSLSEAFWCSFIRPPFASTLLVFLIFFSLLSAFGWLFVNYTIHTAYVGKIWFTCIPTPHPTLLEQVQPSRHQSHYWLSCTPYLLTYIRACNFLLSLLLYSLQKLALYLSVSVTLADFNMNTGYTYHRSVLTSHPLYNLILMF